MPVQLVRKVKTKPSGLEPTTLQKGCEECAHPDAVTAFSRWSFPPAQCPSSPPSLSSSSPPASSPPCHMLSLVRKRPALAKTVFEKSPWQQSSFEQTSVRQWLIGLPSQPENKGCVGVGVCVRAQRCSSELSLLFAASIFKVHIKPWTPPRWTTKVDSRESTSWHNMESASPLPQRIKTCILTTKIHAQEILVWILQFQYGPVGRIEHNFYKRLKSNKYLEWDLFWDQK